MDSRDRQASDGSSSHDWYGNVKLNETGGAIEANSDGDHTSSKSSGMPVGGWTSNLLMDVGSEVMSHINFYGSEIFRTNKNDKDLSYSPALDTPQNHQSGIIHDDKRSSQTYSNSQTWLPEQLAQANYLPIQKFNQKNPASALTARSKSSSKHKRPCDNCRKRKTKCVIEEGKSYCVQCEAKSVPCTFVDQAIKRKPIDVEYGSYKRRHEGSFDNKELRADGSEIVAPNVSIRDVQPVQDYSVINNSLLKKTLSLQFPRSSFFIGPTSHLYDPCILEAISAKSNSQQDTDSDNNSIINNESNGKTGRIEQIDLNSTNSIRKVYDGVHFLLKDDQSPESFQNMSNDVDKIEKFVAPHGEILIELYFRIVHPSYPVLHKKVFLEKYSRTHREFSAPLLAAVYVLAIQWWDYDPKLNRFPKPDVDLILRIALNNYLIEILNRPKLSAVQAGLLLLQCKHIPNDVTKINDRHAAANKRPTNLDTDFSERVLCSQIVSLAEELGIGFDCSNWQLPKWERGLRKRLAWATYMEDKWLSLKHSRPSHITDDNWLVLPLLEEDFPEKHGDGDLKEGSTDIENGKKLFTNFIQLTIILSDMLKQLYSMKNQVFEPGVREILSMAKPLQLRLKNWYQSLPVELEMGSVISRKLCSNGYLQLAYFAAELTLHRKIITAIHNLKQVGQPESENLVKVCRAAAEARLLAAIEFVRDLKPEHVHSFWHSSTTSNFILIGTFGTILYLTSTAHQEAAYLKDQIFNYRWILKISSNGFPQVAEALQKLDIVLNHVPGLLDDTDGVPSLTDVPTHHQKFNLDANSGEMLRNEATEEIQMSGSMSRELYSPDASL